MANTTRSQARLQGTSPAGAPVVEQIYAATLTLLESKSFGDISVAGVLTEAGVSRASFYYYFESKSAVLIGLLTRAMDDIFDTVSPFLTRPVDVPADEALERSIRAVTSVWHRHRLVLRATSRYWDSEPELRDIWLTIVDRFVAAGAVEIEREREAGLVNSAVDSRQLAAALFWGTERVLHVAGLGVDTDFADEEAAVAPLVAMWRGTLYGTV